MKKILAILLAVLMLASLMACGAKEETKEPEAAPAEAPAAEEQPAAEPEQAPEAETEELAEADDIAGMANPITEYASLEEINNLTGGRLSHPAVMGVTDERFCTVDSGDEKIAEYDFTVSGIEYCYRFSGIVFEDISGIYKDGAPLFDSVIEDAAAEFDGGHAARTFTVDGQYVLITKDNGAYDMEQFEAIANEIFAGVLPQLDASAFAGEWHEVIAGRATMTAEANGSELTVEVHWPNTAAEEFFWSFTGKMGEDGTIAYADGVKKSVEYNEEGVAGETVLAEDCSGYLTLNEAGNIEWGETDGDHEGASEFARN